MVSLRNDWPISVLLATIALGFSLLGSPNPSTTDTLAHVPFPSSKGSRSSIQPNAPAPPVNLCAVHASDDARSPFRLRGYYFTLTRMPTFGGQTWREIVDAIASDGGNTMILWMAGGFRSVKFPETWEHNREHQNIQQDFVRDLIDYAHSKNVSVLLGFTPFGYDGVNRMGLEHPPWQATGKDGQPTASFGIYCWGRNLCPSLDATQQFMRDYVNEMMFDFYPNADGLFIESSDYAVCHCPSCRDDYFAQEFRFVRAISDDIWAKSPQAQIVIYPHYFTGKTVPQFGVRAAQQTFDARWSVFFTPHSAPPEPELINRARDSIWWDDSPALRSPTEIRSGAQQAKRLGCSGYVPSLESCCFVCTQPKQGESYLIGKRQVPFGYGWLPLGANPYDELPIRINRLAYSRFTMNPDLSEAEFQDQLFETLFRSQKNVPPAKRQRLVQDALFIHEILSTRRTWCQSAPLVNLDRVHALHASNQLDGDLKQQLRQQLERIQQMQLDDTSEASEYQSLRKIADWILLQWGPEERKLLEIHK
jgi:hypothetical protein